MISGVSIVIPTFKRHDLLERLLESIEKQTFRSFEVIIVDDNSPNKDDYNIVINKFIHRFPKLIFLSNDVNKGAPYCRNRGIKLANYDLIALVDDDDEWLPSKLEKQVEKFENEKVGIVYTWTDAINEQKDVVHQYRSSLKGNRYKDILLECFMPSPSVMVRKQAIEEAGLFDEKFPSCQDWDMWTRILKLGYECEVVEEVLTIYHKHSRPNIGSGNKAARGYKMYYRKHFFSFVSVFFPRVQIRPIVNALIRMVKA